MALTPIAAVIDATGISAPTYADILVWVQAQFRTIYGADLYLGADSQDGQLCGIFAAAVHDCNSAVIAAYNAQSPAGAQGEGLSRVIKINGLRRDSASFSTVDVLIGGQVGTTITDGEVTDQAGNVWLLPSSVVVPLSGEITVTATAAVKGAVTAAAASVTQIRTPTRGWQSVTNIAAATPGAPVESDAAVRRRQATSTALPSRTVLEGMVGAVAALPGVLRYKAYENDTPTTDSDGVPAHSVALVVDGGISADIAAALQQKKSPGSGTYGSTTVSVTDAYGIAHAIQFSRPTDVPISIELTIQPLTGYTTADGDAIIAALVDYINALPIASPIYLTRLYSPANTAGSNYEITVLEIARDGGAVAASNITLDWDEAASTTTADITLTVLS